MKTGTFRLLSINGPLVLACLGASLACAAAQPATASASHKVVLDGQSKGRIFDGIGAVSAGASSRLLFDYPEPQRSQILDYLFKPDYGASLQRLKIEIGADVNSTDGSEPSAMRTPTDLDVTRGYEGWLMQQAYLRNPHIILEVLPWGAPAWVGAKDKGKPTLYTRRMAAYVAKFIEKTQQHYGLNIAYAGLWNEKVYDLSYLHALHRQLALHHLATKIVCCDEYPSENQWAIAQDILKNPVVAQEISAIGVHYPRKDNVPTTTDAARATGKPLWSSEDQPNAGGGPFVSRAWAVGGRRLAQIYNDNYLRGSMTATEIWSPVTSYYDILAASHSGLMYANTPWSGAYQVQSTIWVTAHTTQFAQPGWQYLDRSSQRLPGTGSLVTLASPDRSQWSVVLETIDAAQPLTLQFRLTGGLHASTVHIWQTDAHHRFAHIGDLPVNGSAFHFTFAPNALYTLTTTVGQQHGAALSPQPAPFPMPYSDDFEHTPLHRAARFLADQDGAFEAAPCRARKGVCLEQVITQPPIPWGPLPDPFTFAGNAASENYTLAADVHMSSAAPAMLLVRIDSADVFQDQKAEFPSAYILRIAPNGHWALLTATFHSPVRTLASGSVSLHPAAWHHLTLSAHGNSITATCDGSSLANVRDSSHSHGMFGLGSGWNQVQFDNLRVSP
ncbi:MAG: family 16 glycoside hydrolase [Terracidiphilus sp.]